MPRLLDGKALAGTIRKKLASSVAKLQQEHSFRPRLAAILVGDDPASHVYVRNKVRACEQTGIDSESHKLPASTSEGELLDLISRLNESDSVDGILLQLPLPHHLDKTRSLDCISPAKDVDGLHPTNVGLLVQNRASLMACTPRGIMEILKHYDIPVTGRNAVVLGRSDLVGKPLALLLMHQNATVTVCHSKTKDLDRLIHSADILVAAMGKPAFVPPDWVREGAVVIDVGTTVLQDATSIEAIFGSESKKMQDFLQKKTVLSGDIHPAAYDKSSFYTPVPGGVGPLTIAMLLHNTVAAACLRRGITLE